jgi:hypothetical protein
VPPSPGRIVYAHISKLAGDNAPPAELLAALEANRGAGSRDLGSA